MPHVARSVLVAALALAAASRYGASQTAPVGASAEISLFPESVSFVVRVESAALARSPLLPQLLRRPEAANGLAQALGRASTLAKVRAVYVGFPDDFTPATTELPVLVVGDFDGAEIVADLSAAPGVEGKRREGRTVLEATSAGVTTCAAALGDGRLAVGDYDSVRRMIEVSEGKRPTASSVPLPAGIGAVKRDVAGAGRVPTGLRGYLQSAGGIGPSLAGVDRLSFQGSLGQAMDVQASLHPTTAESRQALQQGLGALVMFGPSRFANDPEVLSAIQSLRFSVGSDAIDVSLTVPRSLLLKLL